MSQPLRSATEVSAGEQFVRALAAKDRAALSALCTDPINFQALTPRKHWQASTPGQMADVILGTWFDPGDDAWLVYNEAESASAAAAVERAADRFSSILGSRHQSDWFRTVRRDGVDRFTVAGLGCFGLHEVHHHLLDADGRLP